MEQNHDTGVFVAGAAAEIEATVVRSTQPVDGQLGLGIYTQGNPSTSARAGVRIRGCLVEQNHVVGVVVADSAAEIEATVVRSTRPVNGQYGRGIEIQDNTAFVIFGGVGFALGGGA